MLYACYDLIQLHTVMELSWRHGLTDFSMPFMINQLSQQAAAIESLRKDNEERKAREKEANPAAAEETGSMMGTRLMLTQGPALGAGVVNGITPQATGYSRAF